MLRKPRQVLARRRLPLRQLAGLLSTALLCVLAAAAQAAAPSAGGREEQRALRQWAQSALFSPAAQRPQLVGLQVKRQDFGRFSPRRSVMNTPLRIGQSSFEHGLGTHAQSEITLRLPEPAQRFAAQIGVDNNYDTAGLRGSVVFAIELAGREIFHSNLCRGGEEPVPVRLDLHGARELTLRVLDGADGAEFDQADWADASVVMNGQRVFLDALPIVETPVGLSAELPFSFALGGRSSTELLPQWKRTQREEPLANGRRRHIITFSDPASQLEVRCEATAFEDSPAVEWVLAFHNGGTADTALLEAIRPLDLRLKAPPGDITLHRAHGSTSTGTDFLPIDEPVAPNAVIHLAPNGGRSSDGALPFFNLAWKGGGLAAAIGWSGQWAMQLGRNGEAEVRLQAGQQTTRLKLRPGESIRTPRILLLSWQGGNRLRGHNLLRRLLLRHYAPRHNGQIATPPIALNTWFSFNEGNAVNEANQLAAIESAARLGVEAFWLDAGWFEGGWPSGVGSWVPRAQAFPRGLGPLGEAAHRKGMKFVLWFEPERVSPNSRIAREHPEWVLHQGDGDGLFNLGDPSARRWLADLLSRCISDWGVDVFRNDFNIDPLRFWQAADARAADAQATNSSERQGLSEIRYIEGLYALWDELLQRHPGLVIDNCASGGRRIDLETISRSLPLWRSDTPVGGVARPSWDQAQTAGLSLFVPMHASGLWAFDPYTARSVATAGASLSMNTAAKDFPQVLARRGIAEIKYLRLLWEGDFYPLLTINGDESHWCGWQLDRPDLRRGFAMFFRRSQSPYQAIKANLHGLDARARYEVSWVDTGKTKR